MDDIAEKSRMEEAPFAKPTAIETQSEPTLDEADGRLAPRNEQPVEESQIREFATEIQLEIEALAINPTKLAVQPVCIEDAIRNILKG